MTENEIRISIIAAILAVIIAVFLLIYFLIIKKKKKDKFKSIGDEYVASTDENYIPKVIYMTYDDIASIPQYVFNNINKYCSGYEVKIYNDSMCIEFLEKYFGKKAVDLFNNMNLGAHKADFWRYCILYKFGGYYFDIKTDFQVHLDDIFDSKQEKTWYTVIGFERYCIYNGIIVTSPRNPILLEVINYMYTNPTDQNNYFWNIQELMKIINKHLSNELKVGENKQTNGWNCILFQEECDVNCGNDCDHLGLKCKIVDKDGKKFFNTRYKDFKRWKK